MCSSISQVTTARAAPERMPRSAAAASWSLAERSGSGKLESSVEEARHASRRLWRH
ncbi:MAG TPA: hypothetical protein VHT26_03140 [Trebonia sp.]|nr:hypothetical protein [Trebonia sp.]